MQRKTSFAMAALSKQQKLIGGLAVSFALSFQLGFRYTVHNEAILNAPTEGERKATFDKQASNLDKDVDFDEWLLGIKKWRRLLVNHAKGDVLEVAVGTARNFPHYVKSYVNSLTVTDFSRPMLEKAKEKKGICSYERPIVTLRELHRLLKEDGKLLLLEHGKSTIGPIRLDSKLISKKIKCLEH
ncbi:methyltransferase domain-containing protein [Cardiosporidium cionae]|uniref:Methyltransferase domain-containing protein n=1 Tax=Cardiosporidium cionae TaxID=476202 RepID=A0ABQ7JGI5_9APIC|nr:methyltransferase domain-containing protein [Cardiosporidium cionae]|eukprot:KAF8823068.1 methyltransferase domain-containing protein [Cardiosporidium cionae]